MARDEIRVTRWRVVGRKRDPLGSDPEDAHGGRHDDVESRDGHSEAAGAEVRVTNYLLLPYVTFNRHPYSSPVIVTVRRCEARDRKMPTSPVMSDG